MNFASALELAINSSRKNSRMLGLGMIAAGILLAGGLLYAQRSQGLITSLILAGAGTYIVLTGHPSMKVLASLRGGEPSLWLPSPSHGVLVATPERLIAGGLVSDLDRHSENRVTSLSFDEGAHAVTVDVTKIVHTRDGEREQLTRTVVKIDPSVTPERAYGFAKEVLVLSQR